MSLGCLKNLSYDITDLLLDMKLYHPWCGSITSGQVPSREKPLKFEEPWAPIPLKAEILKDIPLFWTASPDDDAQIHLKKDAHWIENKLQLWGAALTHCLLPPSTCPCSQGTWLNSHDSSVISPDEELCKKRHSPGKQEMLIRVCERLNSSFLIE